MKIISVIFILNFIFPKDLSSSADVNYSDSKAPLILSTLPFINDNPTSLAFISALLVSASKSDSLKNYLNNPNQAMFLSSIPIFSSFLSSNDLIMIPSPGQIYNKKYFKAFIMSTFKAFWLTEYNKSKHTNIKDRNRSMWWLLLLLLYGIGDAYVDAQLKNNTLNGEME
tara:strand:- start:44724 stop:45230 length:507 start_codon:yes stop_codon:yes gene_type:complete